MERQDVFITQNWNHRWITFYSDFRLAEVSAICIAGLAQVISSICLWHLADLQIGRSTNKWDFGVSAGRELSPVLHPLDGYWSRAGDVALEAQLLPFTHSHWFQRNIKFGSPASLWKSGGKTDRMTTNTHLSNSELLNWSSSKIWMDASKTSHCISSWKQS